MILTMFVAAGPMKIVSMFLQNVGKTSQFYMVPTPKNGFNIIINYYSTFKNMLGSYYALK